MYMYVRCAQMNTVIRGGSTIFPSLNITVKAEKGEALVWFDSFQSSTIDLPEYSSCSVVAGQKWSENKFFQC